MEIIKRSPDPFFYPGEKDTTILLIHGFTGSPAELRLLGNKLNQNGYTVYAPLLAGHGRTPEEMAKTDEIDWWNSVVEAYQWLQEKEDKKIIAIGLSMGGILALKLAYSKELYAVISMAAPIYVRDKRINWVRWLKYLKAYQVKKSKAEHIEQYLASYDRTPLVCVESLHKLIAEVKQQLSKVAIPTLVLQGRKDETVIPESAEYIYNNVSSDFKQLIWYDKSTHIMTLDHEREKVFADILTFLDKLR